METIDKFALSTASSPFLEGLLSFPTCLYLLPFFAKEENVNKVSISIIISDIYPGFLLLIMFLMNI